MNHAVRSCLLLPLDREELPPPLDANDWIWKVFDDHYMDRVEEILSRHKLPDVRTPGIHDLSPYGNTIAERCQHYKTFVLETI